MSRTETIRIAKDACDNYISLAEIAEILNLDSIKDIRCGWVELEEDSNDIRSNN